MKTARHSSEGPNPVTDNIDPWSSAYIKKSTAGRGRNGKHEAYGIKKLRELILELAVRGRLVPQDPNDESARVLLEKVAKEKTKLITEGEVKRQKPLPEILEEEIPFERPENWDFCRIGNITNSILSGGTPSKSNSEYWGGDIPWASVKDLGGSKYIDNTQDYITDAGLSAGSKLADIGDVLICTRMGLGKIAICKNRIAINQDLKAVKLSSKINIDYFLMVFSTLKIKGTGTTVAGIKQEQLLNYVFAIPPLNEQHRIVAKVDELMALCDQLEQQQTDSLKAHQTLVETLLGTLIAKDGEYAGNAGAISGHQQQNEFEEAWQRIAEHFDTLFTTEHSIDQLKRTILQLAVMGKLVPQDPNDEPASVLLRKISEEKDRWIKEGKIKKQKQLPEVAENETPFTLPLGWAWVKFGLLAEFINGDRSKSYPNRNEYVDNGMPWINTGHIEPNGLLTKNGMNYITRKKFETLRGGKIQEGDLVYCLRGATFGKTAFVEPYKEGAIASSLMIIRPYISALNSYIYRYLISPFGRSQIFRFDNGSAQPNLSANSVTLYAFPLPPLEEQHRIVAKVDELMALCDTLKARITDTQTTQVHLADAIVEQAVA